MAFFVAFSVFSVALLAKSACFSASFAFSSAFTADLFASSAAVFANPAFSSANSAASVAFPASVIACSAALFNDAAELAKTAARNATDAAVLAEEKAGVANAAAELATSSAVAAQETADHPTYVGDNFYVYKWNKETKAYDKTNVFVKGDGFSVKKVYPSISVMNADLDNPDIKEGDFVLRSKHVIGKCGTGITFRTYWPLFAFWAYRANGTDITSISLR